eukprot:TRINITY_DN5371_c0_g2_i6.p1 TRINITY_DN5371_c0_g2~~TRINITY_DN5371_c0_g2_i6.p1  ORF type:complete len:318 (+),score=95.45 TRINITY_DN5371_c0_g2_i6:147-1100(+)
MPSTRWACSNCGLPNAASSSAEPVCSGCGHKCPIQESTSWQCPSCKQSNTASICSSCQYRKPLPKDGTPQIFVGMRMVFTGIIPRSIPHSSEWKEWQIAEQRGAQPLDSLDESMTHLIYREGYERSEKVRRALKMKGDNVKVLIADWFYQSVNLGMALDEAPYDLRAPQRQLRSAKVQDAAGDIATNFSKQILQIGMSKPEVTAAPKRVSKVLGADGRFQWLQDREDKNPLFGSVGCVFSAGVPAEDVSLAAKYSVKVLKSVQDADAQYLVCLPGEDPHDPVFTSAQQLGLSVVTLDWIHDSIQVQEVLPTAGPYLR